VRIEALASGVSGTEPNRRLRALAETSAELVLVLTDPTIQATNHWAERALRPAL